MFERDMGFWEGIVDVAGGRGQFRLILQPLVAIVLGIKFGIADARAGNEPFLLRLLLKSDHRGQLLKETLKSIVMPLTLAVVLDGILQYLAHGYVRPLAAVVMGAVLIFFPFAISRSLANRAYRHHDRAHAHEGS